MRRGIVFIGIALLLFAAAALAGFFAAARLAPDRLRVEVERRLAEALDAEVKLGSAELRFADPFPWVRLEAHAGRAVPRAGGGSLEVAVVSAFLDPIALVVGRLDIRSLRLDDAVLTLEQGLAGADEAAAESERDPLVHALRLVERWASGARANPCALPDLEVEPLRIRSVQRDGQAFEWLQRGSGRSECRFLLQQGVVHLSGWLPLGESAVAVRADLEATPGEARLRVTANQGPAAGWQKLLGAEPGLKGSLGGEIQLVAKKAAPVRWSVSLAGRELRGELAGFALDLGAPNLAFEAESQATRLELASLTLRDGALAVRLRGALELPRSDSASVVAELGVESANVSEMRRLLALLPPFERGSPKELLERAETGRIESLELALNTTGAGLRELLELGPLARPGELSGELSARNLRWRSDEAAPSVLSGTLRFTGDRLELLDFTGRYGERALPRLRLTLSGVSNLRSADEIQCVRPAAAPPLPGADGVWRWIDSRRKGPDRGRSWQTLRLELDWVSHPVLLCTLEQAVAELVRTDGGFDFALERGIWARAPISARGSYRGGEADAASVSVDVKLGPPFEAMALEPPSQPWGSGRVSIDVNSLGKWRTRGAHGRVAIHGSELRFTETALDLDPAGAIEGRLTVELGEPGPPRYRVEAQGPGLDLVDLWHAAGGDDPRLSGTLHGAAVIEGRLHDGEGPLFESRGMASLHGRSGEVHRQIPLLLTLALVGNSFNPFGARDRIHYDAIDLVGPLENGVLQIETLTLDAPGVRMAGTGSMQIVDEQKLEGVIGMFFLRTLSSLIDRLPLLNRVFLGENQALAGAYFQVTGNWSKPEVALIPSETLAEGPAGFLLKDIPGFVIGGVKRIQSVLTPRAAAPEPNETKDPS